MIFRDGLSARKSWSGFALEMLFKIFIYNFI
jgi:hypothetical protein